MIGVPTNPLPVDHCRASCGVRAEAVRNCGTAPTFTAELLNLRNPEEPVRGKLFEGAQMAERCRSFGSAGFFRFLAVLRPSLPPPSLLTTAAD